ncbi:MAG: insulinase family protein [Bifidobacteriaceae bacterium]|nr:insulinase family protein [Bifidobacteriaceae bacterium]
MPPAPGPPVAAGRDRVVSGPGAERTRVATLPTGARVLTQTAPAARSATIGFWVLVGSRDEAPGQHGSTHFLEHLVFKGTRQRSAQAIAEAFDAVGGEFNASTTKESTCYYARVLAEDVGLAVELLADMVTSSRLDRLDFENERGVILEELAMNADDPVDVAHEALAAAVFGPHPLARPIAGRPEDIRAVSRDQVWDHYQQRYQPPALAVTGTGAVDPDGFAQLVSQALAAGGWGLADRGAAPPQARRPTRPQVALPAQGAARALAKPTEQAQVLVGCEGLAASDPRRHAMSVLGAVLGGGMSSRLFQEIREKRGLAYSTYCFGAPHSDAGLFGLFAGCGPAAAEEVGRLMEAEWERLAASGVSPDELARAKGQLRGATLLGLEEPYAAMNRLGWAEIMMGELPSIDEVAARIEAVTAAQVQSLAAELAARPRCRVVVGPA